MDTYIRTETANQIVYRHSSDGAVLTVNKTDDGSMDIRIQMPASAIVSHGASTWEDIVTEMAARYNIAIE